MRQLDSEFGIKTGQEVQPESESADASIILEQKRHGDADAQRFNNLARLTTTSDSTPRPPAIVATTENMGQQVRQALGKRKAG